MVHEIAIEVSNGIEKSFSDRREYRAIVLENELQVMLMSDPKTEKAAAAMDVNVGHFSDPEDVPGLAHFLEHMLFLGTEKYPNENSYSSYLSENGGRSNAYTSMENTNYYFDVGRDSLENALDRFAQFFIAPLFTASATDRELNAVDSEHAKNLQDDSWRSFQLEKSTSSPAHPYHKFATGDSKTLRDTPLEKSIDVRKELLAFHERFYSANRMKLCILGYEDLDTLEGFARTYFSAIKNHHIGPPSYGTNLGPFTEEEIGRVIEFVPVKDLRSVEITWSLPSMQDYNDEAPHRYLSNLIGHEGPGSVLSLLRSKGLANELGAGLHFDSSDFSLFKVNIECTDEGISNTDEIIRLVFAYINILKANDYQGVQKWLWEETALQAANSFRFQSVGDPSSTVSRVSSNMQKHSPERVLASSLIRKFDRALIIQILEELQPQKAMLKIAHRGVEERANLSEPWYSTKYTISPIIPETLKIWSDAHDVDLHLPAPNEFLPSDFTIHDFEEPRPVDVESLTSSISCVPPMLLEAIESCTRVVFYKKPKVTDGRSKMDARRDALKSFVERSALTQWEPDGDDPDQQDLDSFRPPVLVAVGDEVGGLLWVKQDTVFKLPKGAVSILIQSPESYQDPRSSVLSELYLMMVQELLVEFAYAAEIAGLFYSLRNTTSGINLSLGGFTHKLSNLLEHLVEALCNPGAFNEGMFQRFKDKLSRNLKNFDMEQPYQHAVYSTSLLLNLPRWHVDEKRSEVGSITLEEVVEHAHRLLKSCSLETIAVGNITVAQATDLAKQIQSRIGTVVASDVLNCSMIPRVVKMEDFSEHFYMIPCRDQDNINSAIEMVFQVGPDEPHLLGPLQVLAHIAQEPCFNKLRTEQQLGYIVFCGLRLDHGIASLRFIVQSSRADPYTLDQKIEDFLDSFYELLESMDEISLQQNIDAVLDQVLEKDKAIIDETRRWLSEIEPHFYNFSRAVEVAAAVSTLTKPELLQFYEKYFHKDGPSRKKLVVGIFGSKHSDSLPTSIQRMSFGHGGNATQVAAHAIKSRSRPAAYYVESVKQFRTSNSLYPVQSHAHNKL